MLLTTSPIYKYFMHLFQSILLDYNDIILEAISKTNLYIYKKKNYLTLLTLDLIFNNFFVHRTSLRLVVIKAVVCEFKRCHIKKKIEVSC